MNRDSEDIQRRILMLLQDLLPTASSTDVEAASWALGCEATDLSSKQPDLLTPQAMDRPLSNFSESAHSFQKESLSDLGDVPAVQDRFHALLKNRLQSEIQQNPPLFPWESEIQDYANTTVEDVVEAGIVSKVPTLAGVGVPGWGWLRQLRSLNLPVPVPEPVLATLLQQCQAAVQSSLRDGAKLVRAVEDLFPEQEQALNYLAGLVMTAPARGAATAEPVTGESFPGSYETAAPAQQMVLSLLAAQEIINTLTLTVSASQPIVDRAWDTDAGTVALKLVYDPQATSLRVQATLPCGGRLVLRNGSETVAQRSLAGNLSAELFEPQPNHSYALEVHLSEANAPLTFAIRLV